VVAVIVLVGLGGWVAYRVSGPLVELSAGARRIADGDFSTKVHVKNSSEIGELAESFNEMTDSLRERSESLTKKVLELATLYEMSRALGSTLDMEELLGSVLDSALRIFDLDLGYVALRDRDTDTLEVRAIRGSRGTDADGAVRSSMSEWVVREGRPLIFNPDANSSYEQIDTVTGAKAALCVPLMSSEGTIGSVTVGSSDARYRFNSDDVRLLSTIANHVTIAIGNIELFSSLQDAYLATVRSLAAAVDAKDSYTRGHSEYVAGYATLIAERLGLAHDQKIALEMAAYLHDIGKIGVSEDILLKPGRLSEGEMVQMRHHPLIGANILKPVAFPWAITPVVRHHHEAWDGSGYPAGLKGEEIPLLARILTVADSYEAITADRPYREGRSPREALAELEECAGTQFDRRIVAAFKEAILEELDGEEILLESTSESIAPEEARAIFSVLVDGVLSSFRKLGGPRLAINVEQELDAYLVAEPLPFRVSHGRITFSDDAVADLATEIGQMRRVLAQVEVIIGRLSGGTLVEHFFADALGDLTSRMQTLARELGLYAD
jgi:putative nucleotidyltransferase with HDIG domain